MPSLKEYGNFFFNFLKNTKQTASIIPTSKSAIRKICHEIDFSRPIVVVEFGPGIGNVAEEVAKRMSPTSRLVLIEANKDFVAALQEKFSRDDRVVVCADVAQNGEQITKSLHIEGVDVVLANIPFTFFDEQTRVAIIATAKEIIKPKGMFIAFPFTTTIRPYLQAAFTHVEEHIIWKNIPPLRVFIARKE